MAEISTPHPSMSVEQYLELERDALVRHEFVSGQLYAMTGGSRRHNLIATNILRRLADAAEDTACRVFVNDMKVRTPSDAFYYPDVMVVCEPEPDDPYVEHEPCLIIEIISRSTETIDRREKLAAYKSIPTLKAYLLVDQDHQRVERHFRTDSGTWFQADHIGEGTFLTPCPVTQLTLAQIYAGI